MKEKCEGICELDETMVRSCLEKGTSGNQRKNGSSEEEEDLEMRACGRDKGETSESEGEEEAEETGDEVGDSGEMEETGEVGSCDKTMEFNFNIDPYVLSCSICLQPPTTPIYHCRDGHIACFYCCVKIQSECQVCFQPMGGQPCIALKKVIKSITSPCKYATFGCNATLLFAEKAKHEICCGYPPLFCPINNCIFSGSRSLLFEHAEQKHFHISVTFSYNLSFMITLKKNQPFMFFLAEDGSVFLLRNNCENCPGNMISVICMDSSCPVNEEFSYEFRADAGKSSLQLRTSIEKMRNGAHPSKAFQVVPDDLFDICTKLFVTVCIYKSRSAILE